MLLYYEPTETHVFWDMLSAPRAQKTKQTGATFSSYALHVYYRLPGNLRKLQQT